MTLPVDHVDVGERGVSDAMYGVPTGSADTVGTRYIASVSDSDAESLLIDLVSIPSPSYHEQEASRWLVEWMAAHGAVRAYVDDAGSAVGEFGTGSRQIVLLGHIDHFGAALPVSVEGRTLHGRGAVDAKGSLCTFAAAAARAAVEGRIPADTRVIVVGAVEEECPTSNGARFAAEQYQPEICIIGEPSNWDRITLGYKGRLLIDWRWQGGLGHSAGQVTTPAEHAFAFWRRVVDYVEAFNAGRDKVFTRLDATLQAVNSGSDGVQGWSDVTVGFRLPPGVEPEQIVRDIDPHPLTPSPVSTGEGGGERSEAGVRVRAYGMEHAYVADKDTALTRALRRAIREQGGTPAFVHKTGTSDMNIVGRVWNCPIAAYGPGDSALDHTPEERIDLDEYLRAVRVLTSALERL